MLPTINRVARSTVYRAIHRARAPHDPKVPCAPLGTRVLHGFQARAGAAAEVARRSRLNAGVDEDGEGKAQEAGIVSAL